MTETKKAQPGMVQLTFMLFIITAVTSLLLGLVNGITKDRIAAFKQEKTASAMLEVLPEANGFTQMDKSFDDPLVTGVFEAGEHGYVFQVQPSGFGGAIDMVVGMSPDGAVTGVAIITMAETSGLGTEANGPEFRAQYLGASSAQAVNKDGGSIDALTGATVTSRAVTSGVNAAIAAFAAL